MNWTKPFAAIWRARAYFLIGVLLWAASYAPLPFNPNDPNLEWWQFLIAKAYGDLIKISYAVLLAGLVYAVISDAIEYLWTTRLQDEVKQGFTGISGALSTGLTKFTDSLFGMSFEAVKVWIQNGGGNSDEIKVIGMSGLKKHYGKHLDAKENLVDFIVESVLDNAVTAEGVTWENYTTITTIKPSTIPSHFEWEERKSYSMVRAQATGPVSIRLENSWQVGRAHLADALSRLEFNFSVDSREIANLGAWRTANEARLTGATFDVETDGIRLAYNGMWLYLYITKEVSSDKDRVEIAAYERSYVSDQDRCYALIVRYPTKGIHFVLSLQGLDKWAIKPPNASATVYRQGSNVVNVSQPPGSSSVSVNHKGWTLPGIALLTEWSPS